MRSAAWLALFPAAFVVACATRVGFDDPSAAADAGGDDGAPGHDGGLGKDSGSNDGGAGGDASSSNDGGNADGSGVVDAGKDSSSLLGPPCSHGPGFVAWKFHYKGSTSAITDVYSLPDNSNWQAVPAFATMFSDALHGGGIEIGSGNWILIRYSVANMSVINGATLSVYGRSYDTTTSGSFDAWSPLYGDNASPTDSVSNAWPYTWTSIDFSNGVHIGDTPGLTGIRLYSGPSSNVLVINTVELCIDGS